MSMESPATTPTFFFPPPPLPLPSPSQALNFPPLQLQFFTPPPPLPDSSPSVDLSPLEFVLAFVAVITIPALVYTFCFSIRFPSLRRRTAGIDDGEHASRRNSDSGGSEAITGVKYEKQSQRREIGSECPVCLSNFAEGEEIKQLSVCKHSFHASCIDLWLNNHSNCPICRAPVPVKRPPSGGHTAPSRRGDDLHQGLPDAASLV